MVNLIHEYRPNGIAVTDLSAQLWCEKQLEFTLEKGREETKEMTKGKERHRKLHEEIATLIKVSPKTMEDTIALKLYNIQVGLKRLILEGLTRELFIFGKINSLFVIGQIDELKIENKSTHILDTKTRQDNTMPSEAQKTTTRFQLMLYQKLLRDLINGKFKSDELIELYRIKKSSEISKEFQKQINDLRNHIEPNIMKLIDTTFELFRKLPQLGNELSIRYKWQENRTLIGMDNFLFDERSFEERCKFVEEFWLGKRKAMPVGIKNAWKCKFCEFRDICKEKPFRLAPPPVRAPTATFITPHPFLSRHG